MNHDSKIAPLHQSDQSVANKCGVVFHRKIYSDQTRFELLLYVLLCLSGLVHRLDFRSLPRYNQKLRSQYLVVYQKVAPYTKSTLLQMLQSLIYCLSALSYVSSLHNISLPLVSSAQHQPFELLPQFPHFSLVTKKATSYIKEEVASL